MILILKRPTGMTRLIPLNIFSPVWRICHKNSKLSDSDNIPLLHNFQQPSSRTTEPYIITMKVLRLCDYDFVSLYLGWIWWKVQFSKNDFLVFLSLVISKVDLIIKVVLEFLSDL